MGTVSTAVAERDAMPAKPSAEQTLRDLIAQQKPALARALPKGLSEERFARILVTNVKMTPQLLKCDPLTFLGAAMQAAQLGLEPGGALAEAYLVPYGNVCTFVPGAPGLIKLAVQSGFVTSVIARTVYAGDEFEYEYGLDEKLVHRRTDDDPGAPTHHYAIATMVTGAKEFIVMSQAQIDAHRKKFAKSQKAWQENPEPMARKTVVKQLMKFLPKSAEMSAAMNADGKAITLSSVGDITMREPEVELPSELPAAPADAHAIDSQSREVQPDADNAA